MFHSSPLFRKRGENNIIVKVPGLPRVSITPNTKGILKTLGEAIPGLSIENGLDQTFGKRLGPYYVPALVVFSLCLHAGNFFKLHPADPSLPTLTYTANIYSIVEVCLKPSSTALSEDVRAAIERMFENISLSNSNGNVPVPDDDKYLAENVQRISICDTDEWTERGEDHEVLLSWQVPTVHVYELREEGPCEELGEDGQPSSFNEWVLPAKEFDGMWESSIHESGLKRRLLRSAASALLFSEKCVDPFPVSWNRTILLHGPPGNGKTSLCKVLAQKLSIRFNSRFLRSQLIEVNAHSLFSKWFSESGNLIAKHFQNIQEMAEDQSNLVFVLIDEVESLAAARKAALSGSHSADSITVVNALLTQLDKLKSSPNVIIMTTSNNITAAVDIAFADSAHIKAYVGGPTLQVRYEIIRSCLQALLRTGILNCIQDDPLNILNLQSLKENLQSGDKHVSEASLTISKQLLQVAEECEGFNERRLRKIPFLAHAVDPFNMDPVKFLTAMVNVTKFERYKLHE